MIYVGNYLSAPPAAFCSSAVSLQAGQLSAEPCCRPFTSISRDCSNCCTRICRPLNLICNVGAGNLEIVTIVTIVSLGAEAELER